MIAPAWNVPCLLCEMVSDLKFGLPFLRLLLSGRCWQLGSGAASREVRCFAFGHGGIDARITCWYIFLSLKLLQGAPPVFVREL